MEVEVHKRDISVEPRSKPLAESARKPSFLKGILTSRPKPKNRAKEGGGNYIEMKPTNTVPKKGDPTTSKHLGPSVYDKPKTHSVQKKNNPTASPKVTVSNKKLKAPPPPPPLNHLMSK